MATFEHARHADGGLHSLDDHPGQAMLGGETCSIASTRAAPRRSAIRPMGTVQTSPQSPARARSMPTWTLLRPTT